MKLFFLSLLFLTISSVNAFAVQGDFNPAWWCRGAHCQTIYGGLFRENPDIHYRRERFDLPDGDFLDLDWLDGEKDKPAVVIFHGLASSSGSSYIKVLVDEVRQKGWTAVVMNARGQSGEPNRLKVTNHAGRSQDVDWTINHVIHVLSLRQNEKEVDAGASVQVYAVGYSLGGNMLMKWLGANTGFIPSQLKKVVSVSAAYDLEKTASRLDENWFNREVYVRSMLNFLKPLAAAKEQHFPGNLNLEAVSRAKTFKVYDREVTAKLNGFKDESDYWTQSSSKNYMDGVTIPALLIHAENDPFLPGADLPYQEMLQSPNLKLLLTKDGGHLGFVSGAWPWKSERWLEQKIIHYFSEE